MPTRRHVLTGLAAAGAAAAGDEALWRGVQQAFRVDRTLVNLDNGGMSPAPAVVHDAMARDLAYANEAPVQTMWRVLEPRKEGVRAQLARHFGCDAEELARPRNAFEGLQICPFGFDLARGDEVLGTDQGSPRMLDPSRQRERREGVKLVTFPIPVSAEDPQEIVRRYAERITPRTRLILVSPIGHADCAGIRVTPSAYTTLSELDRYVAAMRTAARRGIG